jgi:hypothetical protein
MIDFETPMHRLAGVSGYIGSAVLNYMGETLYLDEDKTGVDVAYSASIFNDAFKMISDSSLDIGFSEAAFVETRTADGHIFLMSSTAHQSSDNYSKLNIFAIFRDDGNIALAKMMMTRLADSFMDKMSKL